MKTPNTDVPAIYLGLGVMLFPSTDTSKSDHDRATSSDRSNRGFMMLPAEHAKALIDPKTGRVWSQYASDWKLADQAEAMIKHEPMSVIEACSRTSQLLALKAKLDPSLHKAVDERIEKLRSRRGG